MLDNIFNDVSSIVEPQSILLCTLASIGLGLIVAFTHKLTARHNKNFLITLTILPLLVQIIMVMVNGNLGTSVAILGAFGLIRFRSVPGTSRDILSIFFAMAIGLATGTGYLWFAVIMTLIIAGFTIILSKAPLLGRERAEQILKITVPEDLDYTTMFDDIFSEYVRTANLEKAKTTDMGSLFELTYRVVLKPDTNEKTMIDALREKNGNLRIILSHELSKEDMI